MKKMTVGIVAAVAASALLLTACSGMTGSQGTSNTSGTASVTSSAASGVSDVSSAASKAEEASSAATNTAQDSSAAESKVEEPAATGGWTAYDKIEGTALTEQSEAIFKKAMESWNGLAMDPVALIARQVVGGTNYLYLAKVQKVPENAKSGWYLVAVYDDPAGSVKVIGEKELAFDGALTTDEPQSAETLAGAWDYTDPANAVTLSEDIWNAFWIASEGYAGVGFTPLAVIGTQTVAGTNYRIVSQGITTTEEALPGLYEVTMYVDTEGKAKITDVKRIDINAVVGTWDEESPDKKDTESQESGNTESEGTDGPETPVAGGWQTYDKIVETALSKENKEIFEKTAASIPNNTAQPAAFLARQVAEETNYLFLVKDAKPEGDGSAWFIMNINESTQDGVMSRLIELDPASLQVEKDAAAGAAAARVWEFNDIHDTVTLPDDVWGNFWSAMETFSGLDLYPMGLVATQPVAGTNYSILCLGAPVVEKPDTALYQVTLYVDAEGNANIADLVQLDLKAYTE